MKFPLAYSQRQVIPQNVGPTVLGDIIGSPALTVSSDYFNGTAWFAISLTGAASGASPVATPKILVGKWISQANDLTLAPMTNVNLLPSTNNELSTNTGDTQPTIAFGPNLECYVAFATNGSMPNRYNMSTVPSFCPGITSGTSDIVVAQVFTSPSFDITSLNVTANWWIQDASLNSANNEYNPQLCCDRTNRFLYLVHQCDANILCFPTIGTGPNVVLSCITLTSNPKLPAPGATGAVVWREAQTGINCAGATTNPAIATDQNGGVYVAVEINAPIDGGATPETTQVIDVIKFQNYSVTPYNAATTPLYEIPPGIFLYPPPPCPPPNYVPPSAMSRSYVLSGISPSIFPPDGVCTKPSIACDPVGGRVVLAFTTTGTMPGQTQSSYLEPGGSDVVVISFKSNGTLLTVSQGDMWSPMFNPYTSARDVSLTSDDAGNIFLSYIIKTAAGTESVLAYQLQPSTLEPFWNNEEPGGIDYTAYAYAMTGAPNAIYNTGPVGSFTKTPPAIILDRLFIATSSTQTPIGGATPPQHGLTVTGFTNTLYTFDTSVFNYMANSKSICACASNNCGCS